MHQWGSNRCCVLGVYRVSPSVSRLEHSIHKTRFHQHRVTLEQATPQELGHTNLGFVHSLRPAIHHRCPKSIQNTIAECVDVRGQTSQYLQATTQRNRLTGIMTCKRITLNSVLYFVQSHIGGLE